MLKVEVRVSVSVGFGVMHVNFIWYIMAAFCNTYQQVRLTAILPQASMATG